MRKIEQEMVNAIENNRKWSQANTMVHVDGNTVEVFLHGNRIFTTNGMTHTIDNCGWSTNTTKSRLNAIGTIYGFSVIQRNFEWYCLPNNHLTIAFVNGRVTL